MMKTTKENVGLAIALLIAIFIALELYNSWQAERNAEELIKQYVELISTAINHENN